MVSWIDSLKGYLKPAVFIFFFLGFSCGLPYSLIGYSLSLWMADVGISLSVIGFFALVLIPYNFKFVWAPLIDKIKLPYLAYKIGPKKAWLLLFQIGLILSVFGLSLFSPDKNTWTYMMTGEKGDFLIPLQTYLLSFLVAFFAASQDIVVDALRIDTLKKEEFGEGAGMYQFGYRMGMLIAGAGVVALSAIVGWQESYFLIGMLLFGGLLSTFFVQEEKSTITQKSNERFWYEMVVKPFRDFMQKANWLWILVFIILYKLKSN